jgi:hypothetical protein
MAGLRWSEGGVLSGDPVAKARLAALLRAVLFWYAVVAVLVLVTVLPGGIAFFRSSSPSTPSSQWLWPWIWVVIVSALSLFFGPIFAVIEGCGLVAEVSRQRALQSVLGNVALWAALGAGLGLFAAPVLSTPTRSSAGGKRCGRSSGASR